MLFVKERYSTVVLYSVHCTLLVFWRSWGLLNGPPIAPLGHNCHSPGQSRICVEGNITFRIRSGKEQLGNFHVLRKCVVNDFEASTLHGRLKRYSLGQQIILYHNRHLIQNDCLADT